MSVAERNPLHVLNALVRSEVEVLRAREPQVSSALDVAPPEVRREAPVLGEQPGPAISALPPGLYGYARRGYRFLNRFGPLQPVLRRMRARVEQFQNHRRVVAVQPPPDSAAALDLPRLSRTYTIAFTMRSGSNEICNLLARNGLGSPNEFFQKPLSAADGPPLNNFTRIVSRYQVGGVFGSKMSHNHRAALDEQLRKAIPQYVRIDDVLPAHQWLWLRRRDKILQAISWCRAETSNRWAAARPQPASSDVVHYDFFHIVSRVVLIHVAELAWETYFQSYQINPFLIVYEDFFEDLEHQLPRLIDFLGGLPPGRTYVDNSLTYEIQRDAQNHAMRERFLADLARMGEKSLTDELGQPLQRWSRFFFEFQWRD